MLFNSAEFLFFFVILSVLFFGIAGKYRKLMLLLASYLFYASWNKAFLFLIIYSTLVDYFCGLKMEGIPQKKGRQIWLWLSLVSNLGLLFLFKYYNFFADSVQGLVQLPGAALILPVGISFYTFQSMSYSIDVYHGRTRVERDVFLFGLFVSFFPQLIAGPIERSHRLISQLKNLGRVKWNFSRIEYGLKMILWGMFMKVVVADRLALFVNEVFNHPDKYPGPPTVVAVFYFAFQIYGDFAGYSFIALGLARIIGIELTVNFKAPYLSRSVSAFWKKWHVTLSSWFKDYLYIPLGGSRVIKWRWHYNIMVTFLVSGLWHGAAWTFVLWGGIHGVCLIVEKTIGEWWRYGNRDSRDRWWLIRTLATFLIVCFAWLFFRANNLSDSIVLLHNVFRGYAFDWGSLYTSISAVGMNFQNHLIALVGIVGIVAVDWAVFVDKGKWPGRLPVVFRYAAYYTLVFAILLFGIDGANEFIYFQF